MKNIINELLLLVPLHSLLKSGLSSLPRSGSLCFLFGSHLFLDLLNSAEAFLRSFVRNFAPNLAPSFFLGETGRILLDCLLQHVLLLLRPLSGFKVVFLDLLFYLNLDDSLHLVDKLVVALHILDLELLRHLDDVHDGLASPYHQGDLLPPVCHPRSELQETLGQSLHLQLAPLAHLGRLRILLLVFRGPGLLLPVPHILHELFEDLLVLFLSLAFDLELVDQLLLVDILDRSQNNFEELHVVLDEVDLL